MEEVLYRFPDVLEAAVVSVPHSGLGEDIAACLVAVPGRSINLQQLREHCGRLLADFQVPRHWHVVDALPKNPMGKVLKRELREQLLQSTAAEFR